jgi:hypothetical protein
MVLTEKGEFIFIMWIFVVLKLLDILTTIVGIKFFGLIELNPLGYIASSIFSVFVIFAMLLLINIHEDMDEKLFFERKYVYSKNIVLFLCCILFLVVANNVANIIISSMI